MPPPADDLWQRCLHHLQQTTSATDFSIYLNPLQVTIEENTLRIFAPNPIIRDKIKESFADPIRLFFRDYLGRDLRLQFNLGSHKRDLPTQSELPLAAPVESRPIPTATTTTPPNITTPSSPLYRKKSTTALVIEEHFPSNLNELYTFDQFVEGKSNQLARAAALQVAQNPGKNYNPLFIYGSTGLGKTHLMHAIGHAIRHNLTNSRVVALTSERFVRDMVDGYAQDKIYQFKQLYRSLDALLIDDIQFFAGREGSQEEFFHTFNTLLEGQKQIVLTCDTLPQGVEKIDDRLKSRFSWGLTLCIEPPDLETRVAILKRKAARMTLQLSDEIAFFIAENVRSNIRDLEGALSRVHANAQFRGDRITLEYAREALRDQLAIKAQQVTVENIQKVVADYYKLRVSELLSQQRSRPVARPRQLAMALAKQLTEHSLMELGALFDGRDHTTILHACRQIERLRESDSTLNDDYRHLLKRLTT